MSVEEFPPKLVSSVECLQHDAVCQRLICSTNLRQAFMTCMIRVTTCAKERRESAENEHSKPFCRRHHSGTICGTTPPLARTTTQASLTTFRLSAQTIPPRTGGRGFHDQTANEHTRDYRTSPQTVFSSLALHHPQLDERSKPPPRRQTLVQFVIFVFVSSRFSDTV